jgi:hypothetical protein
LPSSALFSTASATTSGCFFFQGEDILEMLALLGRIDVQVPEKEI